MERGQQDHVTGDAFTFTKGAEFFRHGGRQLEVDPGAGSETVTCFAGI